MLYKFHDSALAPLAEIAERNDVRMDYYGSEPGNIAPDVNWTPARQVYPGATGGTIATAAAAGSPDSYQGFADPTATSAVATPVVGGPSGLMWWVAIVILIALMLFAARKTGQAEEFKNLRASTYNILFITLVAIVGLTGAKILAVKAKNVKLLSGLADVVIAA
jgi:hypothetical protein